MNRLVSLLLLPLLIACTSTQVHIFTDGLDPAELVRVEDALENKGYETHLNPLPVPEGIVGPTLLYSPDHRDLEQVETLGNQLLAMGYDVILEPVSRGNHFYTETNVGLYLQPFQEGANRDNTLEGREYNGDCEQVDAYLTFVSARRFELDFIGWDDEKQQEVVEEFSGMWRRDGDTVALVMGLDRVEFQLVPENLTTQFRSYKGYRLINPGKQLEGCDFVFRSVGTI